MLSKTGGIKMKKQYIQPEITIHSLNAESVLAAASPHVETETFEDPTTQPEPWPNGQVTEATEEDDAD